MRRGRCVEEKREADTARSPQGRSLVGQDVRETIRSGRLAAVSERNGEQ